MFDRASILEQTYSPEELLQYVIKIDRWEDLYYATNNNRHNYSHLPVMGEVTRNEDGEVGIYFLVKGEKMFFNLEEPASELLGELVGGHIITHEGRWSIVLLQAEEGMTPDFDDDQYFEAAATLLMLDFLERLNVDTIRKLDEILDDEAAIWERFQTNSKLN